MTVASIYPMLLDALRQLCSGYGYSHLMLALPEYDCLHQLLPRIPWPGYRMRFCLVGCPNDSSSLEDFGFKVFFLNPYPTYFESGSL